MQCEKSLCFQILPWMINALKGTVLYQAPNQENSLKEYDMRVAAVCNSDENQA